MKTSLKKGMPNTLTFIYGLTCSFLLLLLAACGSMNNGAQAASSSPTTHVMPSSTPYTSSSKKIAPGTELITYSGHSGGALAMSWAPDGKHIASVNFDSTIQVWDAQKGTLFWERAFAGTHTVAWAPDGQSIAVGTYIGGGDGGAGLVYILNAKNGQTNFISQKYDHGITGLAWSPDSSAIAYSVENGIIQVLDIKNNGAQNKTFRLSATTGTVAWSPNGTFLAWVITTPDTPEIHVVNLVTGAKVRIYQKHNNLINALAWSPDSRTIASASSDKTVRVWDVTSGTTRYIYQGHTGEVIALAWSPDGKYIASGGIDRTVQVFKAKTGRQTFIFKKHTSSIFSIVWSPDSAKIASAGVEDIIRVWQAV